MSSRRSFLKNVGIASVAAVIAPNSFIRSVPGNRAGIRYCLNTSTIKGQGLGLLKNIDIAAEAGYDGVELWVDDIKELVAEGKTLKSLKKRIDDNRLKVENAIGFAKWIVDEREVREAAFVQMETEMKMMSELGCTRIAAPPSGATSGKSIDLTLAAQRYRSLVELGEKTGVMPQLEIWGASLNLSRLSEALYIAAESGHPQAKILADVYHLYRGGSDFSGMKLMSGSAYDIFHVNDYPGNVNREQLGDADRVFPGDGVAPLKQIMDTISIAGGVKVLSIELFNTAYWKLDALQVAKEGLARMKKITI